MIRMKKKYSFMLLISVLFMVINPIGASAQENTDALRGKIRLATGLIIGAGVTLVQGIMLFAYTPQLTVGNKFIGLLVSGLSAIPVSILTTNLFFSIFSNPDLNKWATIPLGGLGGVIEGALIVGVTYAAFFGIMQAICPDFSNFENVDSVGAAVLNGFLGGAMFGALWGIIPGAIAAPYIRIFLPQQR